MKRRHFYVVRMAISASKATYDSLATLQQAAAWDWGHVTGPRPMQGLALDRWRIPTARPEQGRPELADPSPKLFGGGQGVEHFPAGHGVRSQRK